jgi:hypothetical protein
LRRQGRLLVLLVELSWVKLLLLRILLLRIPLLLRILLLLPSKWKYWCGGCKCCAGLRYLLRRRRRQVLLLILLLRLLILQQRLLRRHVLRLSHIRRHRDRVRLAPVQVVSVDRRCQAQRRQEIRRKVAIPGATLGSADVPKPRVPRWASASIGGVLQVHKSRHQRIAGAASMRGETYDERY